MWAWTRMDNRYIFNNENKVTFVSNFALAQLKVCGPGGAESEQIWA